MLYNVTVEYEDGSYKQEIVDGRIESLDLISSKFFTNKNIKEILFESADHNQLWSWTPKYGKESLVEDGNFTLF